MLSWRTKRILYTLSIAWTEDRTIVLLSMNESISHFFLVYPFWNGTCLERCIFNANLSLQKETYLGDKFIAIRPWNHELHNQLLCNLIYLFGKKISIEHKNACFNSNIVKYIEMTYSWSELRISDSLNGNVGVKQTLKKNNIAYESTI